MDNSLERSLDARLLLLPPGSFHRLVTKMSLIDEFKGWWSGRSLPQTAMLERTKERVVEVSARASTQLDGRRPARPQAGRLTRAGTRVAPGEPDAARVAGYADVLRITFDAHREIAFGEALILRFHDMLLKYSSRDKGHRGNYKTAFEDVTRYPERVMEPAALRPTIPHLAAEQMKVLAAWAASRLASAEFHPLLVIAGFVLELLAIRPFADGNGRLSRILTNLLLLQCGYSYVTYASLEKVIADQRTEYYLALRTSQASRNLPSPDITSWLNAFLDALRAQIGDLRAAVDRRPAEGLLSKNQLDALLLLERNGEVTNRFLCIELDIPRDTAKQVLNRLLSLGLVQRIGAGRAIRYTRSPSQGGGGPLG